jgi:hypothetical protein
MPKNWRDIEVDVPPMEGTPRYEQWKREQRTKRFTRWLLLILAMALIAAGIRTLLDTGDDLQRRSATLEAAAKP